LVCVVTFYLLKLIDKESLFEKSFVNESDFISSEPKFMYSQNYAQKKIDANIWQQVYEKYFLISTII